MKWQSFMLHSALLWHHVHLLWIKIRIKVGWQQYLNGWEGTVQGDKLLLFSWIFCLLAWSIDRLIESIDALVDWLTDWLTDISELSVLFRWFLGPQVTLHDCLSAFFSADELKGVLFSWGNFLSVICVCLKTIFLDSICLNLKLVTIYSP